MSPIVIRTYQPADHSECEKLFAEVHLAYDNPVFYINDVLSTDMSDIEKNYLQVPNGNWWVAVSTENNRIVGQVAFRPLAIADPKYYASLPEGERDHIGVLGRMAVSADAQRVGVGGKLVSTLIEFARERGFRQVHLTTLASMHKAGPFYEKYGFIKGQMQRYSLGDEIDLRQVKSVKDLFGQQVSIATFQPDDVVPDEDLRRIKLSPSESKWVYVQHYNLQI